MSTTYVSPIFANGPAVDAALVKATTSMQPSDVHSGIAGLVALVDVRPDPNDPETEPLPGLPPVSARLLTDLPVPSALPDVVTPAEAAAGTATTPMLWTAAADRAAIEAALFAVSSSSPPTTFSWTASDGADGYLVDVRAAGDAEWQTHDVGDVLSVELDAIGIYGAVMWEVRVSAWAFAGDGVTREVSAPSAAQTVDLSAPPSSPIARLNDPAHVASHAPRGADALPYAPALPALVHPLAGAVNGSGVSLTNAMTAGRLYAHPFRVAKVSDVTRLEVDIRTGAAGSTVLVAIAEDADGAPGARTAAAVSVSAANAAVLGGSYAQRLYPDTWYWALLLAVGGAPTLAGLSASGMEACMVGGAAGAAFTRTIGLTLDGRSEIVSDLSGETGWANNTAGTAATFRLVMA